MVDYDQLPIYIICDVCHEEIYFGHLYYLWGDLVFCPHCLSKMAVERFHCQACTLGEELP